MFAQAPCNILVKRPHYLRGVLAGIFLVVFFLALILGIEKLFGLSHAQGAQTPVLFEQGPCPGPGPCPYPGPFPSPSPSPDPRPKLPGGSFVNSNVHNGEAVSCDYPPEQHMTNTSSHGLGMCVMTSIEMAALWAGLEQYRGLRNWCAAQEEGGGHPQKVDRQLAAYCKAKGLPAPRYLQYEGADPGPILDLCAKTSRMACITYGYSPRYGGQISHMVCCPHVSGSFGVVMDNNFIGGVDREHLYEWMPRQELLRRMGYPSGKAWVFVWTAPGPPPRPSN